MKRAILATSVLGAGIMLAVSGVAAPPKAKGGDAPIVPTLGALMQRELHWGMTHQEVTDAYNAVDGLLDRDYAPQIAHLQPGIQMQEVEADKENRKVNFTRSYTQFGDTPTGYDVGPLHGEYSYRNEEAVQKIFKDGKTRYFFYIKDKLWKLYDEIPLKADGPFGAKYQDAVTKLGSVLGSAGRVRSADAAQGLDRTTADWQDPLTHLRVLDRSNEHLVGIVLEDKRTLNNLGVLRANKAVDPFAIDPAIAAVTKGGVSDPNAAKKAGAAGAADAGAGAGKGKH
ncbi:MAG TPA: hypothetical protein VKU41_15145 [Polyangiaceae bacterium]|nr:hypothetical protein [Polyangiaceae bacterium]